MRAKYSDVRWEKGWDTFASVLGTKTFWDTQPELEDRDRQQKEVLIIQEEMFSELLYHMNIQKSMGLDGIQQEY